MLNQKKGRTDAIMAVAAILTAWTAFQSAKWSGVQATKFAGKGANRTVLE